jgi:hypothetical protein
MSGNASPMSKMLHEVFGAFFDKNAEKANAPRALRNIGIEESLVRVASTLVFNQVIKPAIDNNFITSLDLGCSRQNGAEIFGRVAAMCASMGHTVSVFDVVKAFNNLRREPLCISFLKDPTLYPSRMVSVLKSSFKKKEFYKAIPSLSFSLLSPSVGSSKNFEPNTPRHLPQPIFMMSNLRQPPMRTTPSCFMISSLYSDRMA